VYDIAPYVQEERLFPGAQVVRFWLKVEETNSASRVMTPTINENICDYIVKRRIASSGMLRRLAIVRTDVSDEISASIIRVTRIGELGTTLAELASVVSYG
jgi:hypothetical protein